jgi:lysophospholipase L1-like esterase
MCWNGWKNSFMAKRRWLLLTLLTVVIFFGIWIVTLYYLTLATYRQTSELYLDPLGLSARQFPELTVSSDDMVVIFYGDSRIASWPPPEGVDGYTFINRGINGQTSVQVLLRFPYDVTPLNPDIVIVQVGVNDLKTIPLFPERKAALIETTEAAIHEIVQAAREAGATVILTTIFPVGDVPIYRLPFWSDDVRLAIDEVNTYLRSGVDEQVIVFNTFALLADAEGKLLSDYADDELHLNTAGYSVLNEALVSLLKTIAKQG